MKKTIILGAFLAFAAMNSVSAQLPSISIASTEADDGCMYEIKVSFYDDLPADATMQFVLKRLSAPTVEIFNIADVLPDNLQSYSGEVTFFLAIPNGTYKFAAKFAGEPSTSILFTSENCDCEDYYDNTEVYDDYPVAFEGISGKSDMGYPDADIDVDEIIPGLARISVARGNFIEDMDIATSISKEDNDSEGLAYATFSHIEDVAERAEEQIIYFSAPAGYYRVKTLLEGEINDDTWPDYGEVELREEEIFHLTENLFCNLVLRESNEQGSLPEIENDVFVFPNPTSDNVTIETIGAKVEIENLSGSIAFISDLNESKTVSLKDLAAGLYILKVYDNVGHLIGTSKLVKQ